jgi:hypothetical protein
MAAKMAAVEGINLGAAMAETLRAQTADDIDTLVAQLYPERVASDPGFTMEPSAFPFDVESAAALLSAVGFFLAIALAAYALPSVASAVGTATSEACLTARVGLELLAALYAECPAAQGAMLLVGFLGSVASVYAVLRRGQPPTS